MTTRMDGFRKRTRGKFRKDQGLKGKISIRKFLQSFAVGDKVYLSVEPAYQKGMYRPKFMSMSATVLNKKGTCYEVRINDQGKDKTLIVHPVHLTKVK
ncbi:MAG TPA: 50S ribosomal protein L21e [Alphaproteobacteria bacterium]|nr:50S ribosomal protein L21e [Alphaproteobacteria bacterium]